MVLLSPEAMSKSLRHRGAISSKGPEDPLQTLLLRLGACIGQATLFILIIDYNLNLNFAFYSWGPTIKA